MIVIRCLARLSALTFFLLTFTGLVLSQNLPYGTPISRSGWTASATSTQSGNDASRVLDGNTNTFWHSRYSPSLDNLPHSLTVDMKQKFVVNGISYRPRQDGSTNGNIYEHAISVSDDGTTWREVSKGLYLKDSTLKLSFFTITTARYVRLTAISEVAGNQWGSIAELNVYTPAPAITVPNFTPVPAATKGRWGKTIDLPIVPAAASITADDLVVFWSAARIDDFGGGTGSTWTATFDPVAWSANGFRVTSIQHDMFCPGSSIDAQGRVIVTGGNDASKTSIYNPSTGSWTAAGLMKRSRGYQSSATLGDGRIFTIGGSWSGGQGSKHGEVYDPSTNVWTKVDGCTVDRILTGDNGGVYRADNHAWLFAWKNNLVFSAGPSTRMTWFNVSGSGSWKDGGPRASDPDAMCATAAMYDAVEGLIVSAGGAPHYENTDATKSTHVIKLGAVNSPATVTKVSDMQYARSFANSVILPDGKVLVVGGQTYPRPFTDTNAILPAELWDPATEAWTVVAPVNVPRTYHSVALLLPDATVVAGGGGLCGVGCLQNHADAQIWEPPYLFNSDGTAAARPEIVNLSGTEFEAGDTLQVTTNGAATFSLIRYGSTTHTVNTDQRRVPLTTTGSGPTYSAVLPSDPGVLLPGPWMLFAINGNGVPSVARTIFITL